MRNLAPLIFIKRNSFDVFQTKSVMYHMHVIVPFFQLHRILLIKRRWFNVSHFSLLWHGSNIFNKYVRPPYLKHKCLSPYIVSLYCISNQNVYLCIFRLLYINLYLALWSKALYSLRFWWLHSHIAKKSMKYLSHQRN